MSNPKITYYLDKLNLGDESDHIEIDREALHGKEVSPEIATVILLNSISRELNEIGLMLHNSLEKDA